VLIHFVPLFHFELIIFSPEHLSIFDIFEKFFVKDFPVFVLLSQLFNFILGILINFSQVFRNRFKILDLLAQIRNFVAGALCFIFWA
jgi:hypothetical protein